LALEALVELLIITVLLVLLWVLAFQYHQLAVVRAHIQPPLQQVVLAAVHRLI
jgi:hypothetical protein